MIYLFQSKQNLQLINNFVKLALDRLLIKAIDSLRAQYKSFSLDTLTKLKIEFSFKKGYFNMNEWMNESLFLFSMITIINGHNVLTLFWDINTCCIFRPAAHPKRWIKDQYLWWMKRPPDAYH